MHSLKQIAKGKYRLKKYPGKGGWTYAAIPEAIPDKHTPFGWVKVKGSIDDYSFRNYKLMPMGNGKLFLPVKAAVRKMIRKEAGDWVNIVLFEDDGPIEIPGEFLVCLRDEPQAHQIFINCSEGQQKEYIDWIYSAKTDATKVKRMAIAIDKLLHNKKFREN